MAALLALQIELQEPDVIAAAQVERLPFKVIDADAVRGFLLDGDDPNRQQLVGACRVPLLVVGHLCMHEVAMCRPAER